MKVEIDEKLKVTVTKDMLLKAVQEAAKDQGLTKYVNEIISKQLADYFNRDHYGKTDFQRALDNFIEEVVINLLRTREEEISRYVEFRLNQLLDSNKEKITDRFMERLIKSIT